MNLNLENKTALVCGGSQGLGLASAKELALLGATVVLLSRNRERLAAALRQLPAHHGQQHDFLAVDLSKPEHTKEAIVSFLSQGKTIHILVNNAGGPPSATLLETPAEDLEVSFRTHLVSSHILAQLLVPGMKQAGFGRIINIISTSAKQPINGLGISNTVRASVANWAKTLSNEIAHFGITVNNVLPGFTNTDRLAYLFDKQAQEGGVTKGEILQKTISAIPAKRLGEPSELGSVVAFLSSPAAAYINGVNLPVDGGRTGCL